jgi:hypothetical protein
LQRHISERPPGDLHGLGVLRSAELHAALRLLDDVKLVALLEPRRANSPSGKMVNRISNLLI